MNIKLPDYIVSVIEKLQKAQKEAYVVGGCVRDIIMGNEPHDYDICTSATPTEIKEIFSDVKCMDTGIKHGTVAIIVDNNQIEITTFRAESQYSDGRHPDSVSFSKEISDDLKRRDFKINAIAYSPKSGLVDPFGGIADISGKVIQAIGDPKERFSEDYLRILRAIRFSSTLSFDIEEKTASAIFELKDKLSLISQERISEELKKAVCGDNFEEVFIKYIDVFSVIIPELIPCVRYNQNNPHHDFCLDTHLAKTVAASPKNYISRLAALFHDIGKPYTASQDEHGISHYYSHAAVSCEITQKILKRLRFSNNDIKEITTLIRYHDGVIDETEKAVLRRINQLGESLFFDLVSLQRADRASQKKSQNLKNEQSDRLCEIAKELISKKQCFSLNRLSVNGNDMISIGLSGKQIGKALNCLLNDVIDGKVENNRDTLLKYCQAPSFFKKIIS